MMMAPIPIPDMKTLEEVVSMRDAAWAKYRLAKTEPELDAACRDVEVADEALDRLLVLFDL